MKLTIIIFLSLTCTNTIAQELKTKKKSSYNFEEIYTIDKKTKLKHGFYVKLNKNPKDTLVKGYYSNEEKVNLWTFYGKNNSIYMQYNYDNDVVKLSKDVSITVDSIQIRKGNAFRLSKVDTPPLFIGCEDEIKTILRENFQAPTSLFENEVSGMSMVSFVVNKTGQIQDISIESSFSNDLGPAIVKSIESTNHQWIPAKLDGNPMVSKMYIIYDIILTEDADYKHHSRFQDKPDLVVIDLIYLGIVREIKVF